MTSLFTSAGIEESTVILSLLSALGSVTLIAAKLARDLLVAHLSRLRNIELEVVRILAHCDLDAEHIE